MLVVKGKELELLVKVKTAAKRFALEIQDSLEEAKKDIEENDMKGLIQAALHEFYTSIDASGLPEANVKAAAASRAARITEEWLKGQTPENRKNILALAMKTFFYEMGGAEGGEIKEGEAPAGLKVAEKLKVTKKLTPEQKKARAADRKKKLEEDEDNEEDDEE